MNKVPSRRKQTCRVTYQMKGRNEFINKIWFSVIFRAEITSTDQDEILWGEEGETSVFFCEKNKTIPTSYFCYFDYMNYFLLIGILMIYVGQYNLHL
jgi:hypothetical protein